MKPSALVILFAAVVLATAVARAEPNEEETLFSAAATALKDGRPGDAIANFEALADRGIVDAAASFDRGLAYAHRVRVGAEQPGDLGQAAHGFEEARELAGDSKIALEASQALAKIRAEVARRRAHAGDVVDVDATSVGRSIVHFVSENAWCFAALAMSLALGGALFVHWMARSRRGKVGATIGWAVTAPLLALFVVMALLARHDRLHLRQAIMVTSATRPADEKGLPMPNAKALPEAALVDIVETRPAWAHVKWGTLDGWVPSTSLRPLDRSE